MKGKPLDRRDVVTSPQVVPVGKEESSDNSVRQKPNESLTYGNGNALNSKNCLLTMILTARYFARTDELMGEQCCC